MIAVTGANGYLGGRVLSHLRAQGSEAIALVRRPDPGDERARRYALATPLDPGTLEGVDTVIHAAYDLSARGKDIRAVNAAGSLPLIDGVAAAGGRVVMISSMAAFEGARSQYGQAKLELERAVLERGGVVLRPGLVFGLGASGLFGALVDSLSRRPVAPLIGGGWQRLFLTHEVELCELIAAIAAGQVKADRPLFAAHEVPSTLRAIAGEIARAHGRRLTAIPVPSALAYLGLRSAELAGLRLPFRADSLRSLLHPMPLDQVSALARCGIAFPALTAEACLGERSTGRR